MEPVTLTEGVVVGSFVLAVPWKMLPATEFDALRAEVERLTRERDEARALLKEFKARLFYAPNLGEYVLWSAVGDLLYTDDPVARINAALGRKEGA